MNKFSSLGITISLLGTMLPSAFAAGIIVRNEPINGFLQGEDPEWSSAHQVAPSSTHDHRQYHRDPETDRLAWLSLHASERGTAGYNRAHRLMVRERNMLHRQFHMGFDAAQLPYASASEHVQCVFDGSMSVQSCYNATESDTPFPFSCSGIGFCNADLKGPKELSVTWRSTCGGYGYTTLDGHDETVHFSCGNSSSSSSQRSMSSSSSNSSSSQATANQASVTLGAASTFAVLAGSTVTNIGATTVSGDLGVSPGSAVTGFPPGFVALDAMHATDTLAAQAKLDLTTAYNDLAGRTLAPVSVAGSLGGMTLAQGLYKSTSGLEISSGDLTLDAKGDSNAIFIFQIASTLNVTTGRHIVLIGGAKASNVYWQVGTSANLEANSVFKGSILADQSISLQTGASVDGRLLARIGGVTLQGNTVTVPN